MRINLKIKARMKKRKNRKIAGRIMESVIEEVVSENDDSSNLAKKIEFMDIAELQPHPRNYRDHPDDQIDHLAQSIKDNGFYRNIIISRDGVILAGHGAVKAASKIGLRRIPVIRLDIDSNDERALKVLVGDNEIARLAMMDDRALTELLKELKDWDPKCLLGTGFNESMIAALTFVTRPASEIKGKDEAAQWIGMPEFGEVSNPLRIIVNFRNETDRATFMELLKIEIENSERETLSVWWPPRARRDLSSYKFKG